MEKEIRNIIQNEMEARGINQTGLAELTGMTRSAISQIMRGERGRVSITLINILSKLGYELTIRKKAK